MGYNSIISQGEFVNLNTIVFSLNIYFYLFETYLQREGEKEGEAFNPLTHFPNSYNDCGKTRPKQEAKTFSGSPARVQGPKHLNHPLQLSQAHHMDLMCKWGIWN